MRKVSEYIFLLLLLISLCFFLPGCRKSAEQLRAEREARERAKKEKEYFAERSRIRAREKYALAREKGLARKYKEAIDLLDEAESLDNSIRLETQLFRNRMAEDMLKMSADFMEDGLIEHADKILRMLDDKKRFDKYMVATKESRQKLEWFRKGYIKLSTAQQFINTYKTAEAIPLLKEIVSEYAKTRLADKAAAVLRTLGQ